MKNDDPIRLAKLLVIFFQQFQNKTFDDEFRQAFLFDELLKVQFTLESKDV